LKRFVSYTSLVLIISILIGVLSSCQKQAAPTISGDEVRSSREMQRLEACSQINFSKGVLLYRNTLLLFTCTKWDEEFPNLFKNIKEISQASWDQFFAPVDEAFIENQARRDRLFRNIRYLDSQNGLDDLSYVITALNETNFFDSTKAMFDCMENPADFKCFSRKGRIPSKRSIKNIIKLIDLKPDSIENFSRVIKVIVKALSGQEEVLRLEVNKFKSSPLYVPARLKVVDMLAAKVRAGLSEEDRRFLAKVLYSGDGGDSGPWIFEWLQNPSMNREVFKNLVEYPIVTNPEFINEFKGIGSLYNEGFNCSIKSPADPNLLIEFDLRKALFDYAEMMKNSTQKRFFEYASSHVVGLKMSSEVCQELEKNKYNVNLNKALVNFLKFSSEKNYYQLAKFLITQTTAKADPNRTIAENLYIADLVANAIFSSVNNLNTSITSTTKEFYPVVFDIVKTVPPETYLMLGDLSEAALLKENDSLAKGVADFWNFFNDEEKNFLFNFVDRHFDNNTKYVLLFDFYSRFLDDFRDAQPVFKDRWMGSSEKEEITYLALQDLLTHLSGKETLSDFKRFFSRNHILKILEVLSTGQQIVKEAQNEIEYTYSDKYILRSKSEPYKYKVTYKAAEDDAYDVKPMVECLKTFNDVDKGFYQLIHNLPKACSAVTEETISLRLFGWLSSVESAYTVFKIPLKKEDALFDEKGVLSPYMINNSIAFMKAVDTLLGPVGSTLPTKNGVSYLMSSTNEYLNQKGGALLIDQNLDLLQNFLNISPDKNIIHRNSLVKKISSPENFSYLKNFFQESSDLILDYGQWIKSGEYQKAASRSLGTYDPQSECSKVINQFVAPNPCPSKEIIKQYGNDTLKILSHIWEKDQGSPIGQILKALKPDEGLDIPLRGKVTQRYHLSLEESFRYFYDTSDKSLAINNEKVKFKRENGDERVETLTTLERVETVIREVRFDNNYLGVAFLNNVVQGDDYNADVLDRRKLLSKCLKIPILHCGKLMSRDDLRMGRNSLEVFDGLLDVNNGRGLEKKFQFGNYLKTFEQTLVASSSMEAQKARLLPLKKEALLEHNGVALGNMTMVSAWSNAARVIRDRVGRTRRDFENFISSENFKRVDRAMLYGFDTNQATPAAEKLLTKLSTIPAGEKQTLFDHTIDWVSGLNYEETRLVEDTLARLMVVGSYLGPANIVFNSKVDATDSDVASRYKNNNLFQIFMALEKLVDHWSKLKTYFPEDVRLIEVVKPINTALYYLCEKLNSSNDPKTNKAYIVLNDLFALTNTSIFEDVPVNVLSQGEVKSTKGLDFVLEGLKDNKIVESTYKVVRSDYKFLDVFYQNNGNWFFTAGQNLKRLASSDKVDFQALREYLEFSSKPLVCEIGSSTCSPNYHYDEVANLLRFMTKKNDSGTSYFMLMNKKVMIENVDQISRMLDELLPCISVKDKKLPLFLN
jgi:hypothetical protein